MESTNRINEKIPSGLFLKGFFFRLGKKYSVPRKVSKNNCAESMRLSRADNPVQRGEENPAGSIAERDHEDREDCPAVPQACHPEVKHVGHTVLCPAENEHHHAEEEGEIFAKLMGIAFIPLDGNIDEDVAEDMT